MLLLTNHMKMKTTSRLFPVLMILALLVTPACNTSKTFQGAMVGGALGGIIGGALGSKGKKARGILIGSVIGGTAGALVGKYMDKQAEEMRRDLEGAKVERVGEGILITFDSGLMFDVDQYNLKSATRQNLQELADVLQKYDDTEVLVQGHTDSTGEAEYNLELSNNRAKSVYGYLVSQGVSSSRLVTMGLGETEPIADNQTATGRKQNRRVEIAIVANKKLRRAAEKGQI
jgi:outer membrane protein OmpA-like peptidoglycan-associated protein